jgi:hypothetical protein
MFDQMRIDINLMQGISPATSIPASSARMAEDGVLMTGVVGLERAATVPSFTDRGFGERNPAKTSDSRLDSEESLSRFDIVDKMEVEKEDEACCLRFGFWISSK